MGAQQLGQNVEVSSGDNYLVPAAKFTWGADGLASERIIGTESESLYYQYGPQGEARYLTDSTGAVAKSYLYNAYGKVLTGTGTKFNKHMYGGKFGYYSEGGMGLILAGQRWYSSFVMKWLSRDPIRYGGGDNLYGYVDEDPVNLTDPSGLWPGILPGQGPEWHHRRNRLGHQHCPPTERRCQNARWDSDGPSLTHGWRRSYRGKGRDNQGFQCVYNEKGRREGNPEYLGTYDYTPPHKGWIERYGGHVINDFIPWILWGN